MKRDSPLNVRAGVNGISSRYEEPSRDLTWYQRLNDSPMPNIRTQKVHPVTGPSERWQIAFIPVRDQNYERHQYYQGPECVEYAFHKFYRVVKSAIQAI